MGRPRVKTIDDSQPTAEVKDRRGLFSRGLENQKSKVKTSSKIEQAKTKVTEATEARGDGEKGVPTRSRSERLASEDAGPTLKVGRDIEPAGPRATEKSPQKPGKTKPRGKKYQEAIKDLDRSKTYPINEAIDLVKKMSYSKFNATLEAHINTLQTGIRGLVSLPYRSVMPNPKNGTIFDPSADGLKKTVAGFQAGKTEYEHSSKILYKTEPKAPVVHLGIGKLNQPNEELAANIKTLIQTIGKTKIKKITLSPTMGPGIKLDLSSF